MEVRVLDNRLAEPLARFLRERGCVVDEHGDDVLYVNPLDSTRSELAPSVLADILQFWLRRHPGSVVALDARR
jgi:hypothetical protein